MRTLKRICVFCGSSSGDHPAYLEQAKLLGQRLAEQSIELVYGGASVGLMGSVANSVLRHGGNVIGVIPKDIADRVGHTELSELYIVGSMHERKTKMFELSDGFIALPGGFGTLEEVFEIITWSQLNFHDKPCGLLNTNGYYNLLIEFIQHSVKSKFIKEVHANNLLIDTTPAGLIQKLATFEKSIVQKW